MLSQALKLLLVHWQSCQTLAKLGVTPTDAILALATLVDIIQIKPILFVSLSLGCTRIAATVAITSSASGIYISKVSSKPYVKLDETVTVAILAFVTLGDMIQTNPICVS